MSNTPSNTKPVQISGDALKAYSAAMRKWTGWPNATLTFGDPMPISPWASCDPTTRECIVNPEELVLNPHRVLLTVTPFRMKQEAVLTGAMLHEAGHARHSRWTPQSKRQRDAMRHDDGTEVTDQEMELAKVFEEARIEGLIARRADQIGATGLGWTMRASAAYLLPMTDLATDPDQAMLDLVTSWVLRAGRQIALGHHTDHNPQSWVSRFTSLTHRAITTHLEGMDQSSLLTGTPSADASKAMSTMFEMVTGESLAANGMWEDDDSKLDDGKFGSDTGTFMIDRAKTLLSLLFPETDSDDMPSPGAGAGCAGQAGEAGDQSDDQSEGGSPASQPGDEGSEGDEAGEGASPSTALAEALAEMEAEAKSSTATESKETGEKETEKGAAALNAPGGSGSGGPIGGGWRNPTIPEREIQKEAERFLRNLIEPTETSHTVLTEAPSATVDGAALSAWKAGGQVRDPHFFRRVKRTTEPGPPVKIAILVDVSASMEQLQKPSAVLSWALASACLDLRNFAGRGTQVESTLIHWGSSAEVIQRNGTTLPGIREVSCNQGTTAMDQALDLVADELPGFFDIGDKPSNNLLVQFTDWELMGGSTRAATREVSKALEAGVNMLTVAPTSFSARYSQLSNVLAGCQVQRGRSSLIKYNPQMPGQVWESAAEVLR